jgi:hypothetical protein
MQPLIDLIGKLDELAACKNCQFFSSTPLFGGDCRRLSRTVDGGMACECFEGNSQQVKSQLDSLVAKIITHESELQHG